MSRSSITRSSFAGCWINRSKPRPNSSRRRSGGVVSQSLQVVRANELSCGALSPYGCELTLRKLEAPADVDLVRSLAASPPTIETFISSGGSPGNHHSPGRPTVATISRSDERRTLNFASTFAKT